jgi:hypothetical protein
VPTANGVDEESDGGTSFTEDDDADVQDPLDEIEDEEDRLILNGGAGIPIGPVRTFLSLHAPSYHLLIVVCLRMAFQNLYFPQFRHSMPAVNALYSIWTRLWFTAASRLVN